MGDKMLDTITFKTELNELLTLEEVVVLFDTIKKKSEMKKLLLCLLTVMKLKKH